MAHRKTQPVALVPFVEDGKEPVGTDNLLQVAAALNIQAVRDLAPSWNVSAIVSPFSGVSRVPPGYDVIVILPKDSEFTGPKGFHFLDTGVAIAVVNDADDWSLFASHELMEMLVDRRGDRTASGPSLRSEQGRVDYLVEVCDPCQHSTYTIDGVLYPTSSHPATTAMRLAMVDSIRTPDESSSPARFLTGDTSRGPRSRPSGGCGRRSRRWAPGPSRPLRTPPPLTWACSRLHSSRVGGSTCTLPRRQRPQYVTAPTAT